MAGRGPAFTQQGLDPRLPQDPDGLGELALAHRGLERVGTEGLEQGGELRVGRPGCRLEPPCSEASGASSEQGGNEVGRLWGGEREWRWRGAPGPGQEHRQATTSRPKRFAAGRRPALLGRGG